MRRRRRATSHEPRPVIRESRTTNHEARKKTGTVFLVGAGPGDPGLLTLQGLEKLKLADVVLYDGLVPSLILDFAEQAEKIFVGKSDQRGQDGVCPKRSAGLTPVANRHCRAPDQDEINRRMVELARQGKQVVRLKGGDPFVFGRGGEEAEYLKKHGIPFEIVPGVSAGHAVPAMAGIPVTDRRFASAVIFVTAHEDPEKTKISVNWKKLAEIPATIVCFMGVKSLAKVAAELIAGGKSPLVSVCMIERGTMPQQKIIEGTLQNIAERAEREKIESPALTVIGDVVNIRYALGYSNRKAALSGKRVLITRATADIGPFKGMLEKEGAIVLEAPMIKIEPPRNWNTFDKAVKDHLERSGWVLFTSAHAVNAFFDRLGELGLDSRALSKCKVAAVGDKTADCLKKRGINADLVPQASHSRELLRELTEKYFVRGQRFLWPRADIASLELKNELEQAGARVTDAILYHTLPDPAGQKRVAEILSAQAVDFVVFTSGSAVRNFFQHLGAREIQKVKGLVVSIGPQTTEALGGFKIPVLAEAKQHNLDGLIETLKHLCVSHEPRTTSHAKRQETGDQRHETEKLAQSNQIAKPVFKSSSSVSRLEEAKARIHSQASRSLSPEIQRFSPRPRKRR